MDAFLRRMLDEPILLAIVALILGALVYALVKKVLKLGLILAIGLACLFGYFAVTGKEPPSSLERLKEKAQEKLEQGLETAREKAEQVGEKTKEKFKEAAEEALETLEEDL